MCKSCQERYDLIYFDWNCQIIDIEIMCIIPGHAKDLHNEVEYYGKANDILTSTDQRHGLVVTSFLHIVMWLRSMYKYIKYILTVSEASGWVRQM